MVVASEWGGYFLRVSLDSPTKGGRKPFLRAMSNVERAGENSEAWAKATKLAGVASLWLMALAGMALASADMALAGSGNWVVQRLEVSGSRVPEITISFWYAMSNVVGVMSAVHPASLSWGMEMRLVVPISENTCTSLASGGRLGMGSSAVWVECMNSWLANWTGTGLVAGCTLTRDA